MSINRNRAKLNKAKNSTTYKKILNDYLYPPYYDEGVNFHYRRTKYSIEGSKNYSSWSRKEITHFKFRMYRTWKYNRKTQWK